MATWNLQKRSRPRARRALTKVVFAVLLRRVARRAPTQDTIPPSVTVVSPAAGSVIVRTDPIVVDVTDASGLRNVQITAYYPASGLHEVVWDGDQFSPFFVASVRSVIANGYRFTMRRTGGGWLASPTFRVTAIDTSGNEGV